MLDKILPSIMPGCPEHIYRLFLLDNLDIFFLLMKTEKNITIKFNYYLFSNKLDEKCFTNSLKQKKSFYFNLWWNKKIWIQITII